jgi:RNA polymerase sigma-70 factor (ECF subfamily)
MRVVSGARSGRVEVMSRTAVPSPLPPAWMEAFRGALPEAVRASSPVELAGVLERLVQEARTAWPELEVPGEDFLRFVAVRLRPGEPVETALEGLRAADLYLACACARQVPGAIAAFEARYFDEVGIAYARERSLREKYEREDLEQMLRQKLFVGAEASAPRIEGYTGRGDLRSWFRVVVVRLLLDLGTRERVEPVVEEEEILRALPEPRDDPELEHLKRHYQAEFREAFLEAAKGLTRRERNLLRHWFVEGMSIDQLGIVHGVHRATAARWLAAARGSLVDGLRRSLMTRLGLGQTELPSIMRLLRSQLVITPRAFLTREETKRS